MRTLIVITILSAIPFWLKTRVFEALLWTLLTAPILSYLISPLLEPSTTSYIILSLLTLAGWCFFNRSKSERHDSFIKSELETFVILVFFYLLIFILTQQWDQFFPIGERLRDYALLSSVIRSPLILSDPWLHGFSLNYYAYWYRFGHFLSSVTGLDAGALYSQLQALTYALYLTSCFRICTRFLKWSVLSSFFSAVLIGFGSNLEGLFSILQKSDNWWGPSRVIPGAIHEFPVWSFLLGDLHPHYLNLVGIPALLLLLLHVLAQQSNAGNLIAKIASSSLFLIGGALFVYNANAWEVPIWGLLCGGLMLSLLISEREQLKSLNGLRIQLIDLFKNSAFWAAVTITALLSCSLWYSSRNILPNPYPISFVTPPIAQTTLLEFLRHWGLPTALTLSAFLTIGKHYLLIPALLIATLWTLYNATVVPLLIVSAILLMIQFTTILWKQGSAISIGERLLFVCIIAAIILCLIPEFIFLNDPYGGENERMNTIFKIYSSNWFLFNLGALFLFREFVFKKITCSQIEKHALFLTTLILLCAFFVHTVTLRKSTPRNSAEAYGSLAIAEDNFPGSASTIQFLRAQSDGIVLEAQGNAYDWTSFIATLSDKNSFLGWANHVNLLIREYDEIARREKITAEFYSSPDCEARRSILETEEIKFAVVGALEDKKHPGATKLDYSCLTKLFEREHFRVFSR